MLEPRHSPVSGAGKDKDGDGHWKAKDFCALGAVAGAGMGQPGEPGRGQSCRHRGDTEASELGATPGASWTGRAQGWGSLAKSGEQAELGRRGGACQAEETGGVLRGEEQREGSLAGERVHWS